MQFASVVHTAHRPSLLQIGAAVPQSVFTLHWTQSCVVVLQIGFAESVQSGLVAHAKWHLWSRPQSDGALQSPSTRHCSHWPLAASQIGATVPQSALVAHVPHRPIDAEQIGLSAGQSVFARHWTHAPALASQTAVGLLQFAFAVHFGWHW